MFYQFIGFVGKRHKGSMVPDHIEEVSDCGICRAGPTICQHYVIYTEEKDLGLIRYVEVSLLRVIELSQRNDLK
jgi:hypothetical protein